VISEEGIVEIFKFIEYLKLKYSSRRFFLNVFDSKRKI